jgi:hypothetical protein
MDGLSGPSSPVTQTAPLTPGGTPAGLPVRLASRRYRRRRCRLDRDVPIDRRWQVE